ncbi:CFC_HP_G0007910.mRNA.1.CDS.1 [Saccharomyces cerevisiae]|nr:CFC_HP_G0007910.mRNA.1.CDS.1 [Saccharomyces cerevisiae]CAI6924783.1 CFC_HP_G0007910.mRNA.1.CDS.1 [Saccharomyces cerevisiae]
MGKRKKSTRKPTKRLVQKLDTEVKGLFGIKPFMMTKKNSIGTLSCKICGQSFQTRINSLSQPVDVYSDWFDAVEEVNSGRGSDTDDGDEGSDSDYESDSEQDAKTQNDGEIDSDEEEVDSDEERIGQVKRGRGALVDSDDE